MTAAEMATHLARRADEVVHAALTERLGAKNWDPHDVARRVRVEAEPGGETFYLDGEPLLWLGKPDIKFDDRTGTISCDREWRKLP
jgi:hypothetical protein